MEALELATIVKGTSWPDIIISLELNEQGWENDPSKDKGKQFPIEKDNYIRSVISGRIKLMYPDRMYVANREVIKGTKVLTVRRIK